MVRLWDETDTVRVYWTEPELNEETKPCKVAPVYVAWVDGVFYRAPVVEVRDVR